MGRGIARRTTLVLVTLLLLAPVPSDAAAGGQVLTTSPGLQMNPYTGRGWGPCATLDVRPNPAGFDQVSQFRADLDTAVGIINEAAGRSVYRVGPDTTARDDNGDGIFSLSGGSGGYNKVKWRSDGTFWAADVVIFTGVYAEGNGYTPDSGLEQMVHELTHALGLVHVADTREIMSYEFDHTTLRAKRDLGPGTRAALRHLYNGDCATDPVIQPAPVDFAATAPFKNERLLNLSNIEQRELVGPSADSVIDIGHDLLVERRRGDPATISKLVLCRDDVFADCLGGAALAGADGALAFVPGGPDGRLQAEQAELYEDLVRQGEVAGVVILGGPSAVSEEIERQIGAWGGEVIRLAGDDRIATAAAISDAIVAEVGERTTVVLARADNPADAVTAGAVAARHSLPILLSYRDRLPETAVAAIQRSGAKEVVLLGGTAALSEDVEQKVRSLAVSASRAEGRSRDETSVAIAVHPRLGDRRVVTDSANTFLVNGWHEDTWALALAAAPVAARERAVMLLARADHLRYTPAADGYPGDPGWYLLSLDADPSGTRQDSIVFARVGNDRWTPRHVLATARDTFRYCTRYSFDCRAAQG